MKPHQARACIIQGVQQDLGRVPAHANIEGITRYLMCGAELLPGIDVHIAIHRITSIAGDAKQWRYSTAHSHEVDEINLVIGDPSLSYRYELDGKETVVTSPATILIPRGVIHRAEAIAGSGTFICIVASSELKADSAKPV